MKPESGSELKWGLTGAELRVLEYVTAHMDDWIEHICERTDQILMSHGFEPGGRTRNFSSSRQNGRRVA